MKVLTASVKIFLTPLLLMLVWIYNWRPADWFINNLKTQSNLSPTTKAAINIAVLTSIFSLVQFLWSNLKRPIQVTTTLYDEETRRTYSIFDRRTNDKVYIHVEVKFKVLRNLSWVLKLMNGIVLTMKGNEGVLAFNFDFLKHRGGVARFSTCPIGVLFFTNGYSVNSNHEEEFKLTVGSELVSLRSCEFSLRFSPNVRNCFLRGLAYLLMKCVLSARSDVHKIDCKG